MEHTGYTLKNYLANSSWLIYDGRLFGETTDVPGLIAIVAGIRAHMHACGCKDWSTHVEFVCGYIVFGTLIH
jgi:hypothetical protein